MATTLQPPPPTLSSRENLRRAVPYDTAPSTGMWIGLAAITMTFAAFTSAMVVRQGSGNDWRHFSFPTILYFNTAAIVASSVTLQIGRGRFAALISGAGEGPNSVLRGLYGTLILGCTFVVGQCAAWQQLRSDGLYLASAPSSSFFYVFTVLHAVHVIGGLLGLGYAINKLHRGTLTVTTFSAVSQYWHFIGLLWIYLLVLLRIRI